MDNMEEIINEKVLCFAAIDKSYEQQIPVLEESETRGKQGMINYGKDNMYPEYLHGLYNDVTTLKTIIDGIADYVAGDDAIFNIPGFEKAVNRAGDTARELITWLSRDYKLYGGCAYEVIRNKAGKPAELNYLDFRFVRSDKDNQLIFYNEEFGKKYAKADKTLVYPKFNPMATEVASSVVYIKNVKTGTYPTPDFSGAIKACEIERAIDNMHLGGLSNGFMASYLINFLNGIPADEQKEEIEKSIREKFAGSRNAGRFILNFAKGKDNAANVQKLDVVDFGEKYQAAADRSREQIYASFRAQPVLFGLQKPNGGFSDEDYMQSFKIFNRTVVKPIQRLLTDSFDKVFGVKGSCSIVPFSIDWGDNSNEEIIQ